jgi:hypothetical protein
MPMGFECEQYIESDLYEVIKQLKEFWFYSIIILSSK